MNLCEVYEIKLQFNKGKSDTMHVLKNKYDKSVLYAS